MANIMVRVEDATKELWVAAAHDERVSLSEWIRRCCDGGLDAGAVNHGEVGGDRIPSAPASSPRPSFPVSVREFKGPDPKGGKK